MKVEIVYNRDVNEKGNNIFVNFDSECKLSTYITFVDSIDVNYSRFQYIINFLSFELSRTIYNIKDANILNFLENIMKDSEREVTSFIATSKVFCKINDMGEDVKKFIFTNFKNETMFYHVSQLDNEMFKECSRLLTNYLKMNVFIDNHNFKMMVEQKKNEFVVKYDQVIENEIVSGGVDISVGYDRKKNKFILRYKNSSQIVDYTSISSSSYFESYEKWDKVLKNFVTRIKIVDNEDVEISNKLYVFNTLIRFNDMMVKAKEQSNGFGVDKIRNYNMLNLNIKSTANILELFGE